MPPHAVRMQLPSFSASMSHMMMRASSRSSSRIRSPTPTAGSTSTTPADPARSTSRRQSRRGHLRHVAVRIRPQSVEEVGLDSIWSNDEATYCISLSDNFMTKSGRRKKEEFFFDSVFHGSDNHHLYTTAVRSAVISAMEGINATVFAYGQTASGKTYSMMGFEEQPGVIPQAIDDVFDYIRNPPSDHAASREFLLRASYIEIYNETIRDLLNPDQHDLRIHEDRKRGICVSPLREEIVTTPKQLMKIISRGEANRSVGSTNYNERSSRSHTIFTLMIESRPRARSGSTSEHFAADGVAFSQLHLIDLAGSEKATDDADRRKEGSYINRSLLNLGTVISRITDGNLGHIPYRDSKLTRILQSSLSGHSRIAVIATISPTIKHMDESLNTLKFASRIKRIIPKPEHTFILDERALIKRYQHEIGDLRAKLAQTNLELERERHAAMFHHEINDLERQRYEEQLEEARLSRTALKERIDHLTRLILTPSSISHKPLLDWGLGNTGAQGADDGEIESTSARGSVILASGLLPSASTLTRSSMIMDSSRSNQTSLTLNVHRLHRTSSISMRKALSRQASDQSFMQKHIEEIDKRDQRIRALEDLLSSIKQVALDASVRDVISSFEKQHGCVFEGDFIEMNSSSKSDDNLGSVHSSDELTAVESTLDAIQIQKYNQELEVVVQEQQHQIDFLTKRLEETHLAEN